MRLRLGLALTLIPATAIAVVWFRGYSTADEFTYRSGSHAIVIFAERGMLLIEIHTDIPGGTFAYPSRGFFHSAEPSFGRLDPATSVARYPAYVTSLIPGPVRVFHTRFALIGFAWQKGGFRWPAGRALLPGTTWDTDCILLPLWFFFLTACVCAARPSYIVIRDRRRQISGRCVTCGYDLRASGPCCPECGTTIKRPLRRGMASGKADGLVKATPNVGGNGCTPSSSTRS